VGIGIRGFVDSIFPGLGSSAAGLVRHFFRGQGVSITAPSAASLQLQTSTLGRAIAAIFGTMRIAPNLIWFGDFMAIAHTSTEGGGGKGGGGAGSRRRPIRIRRRCSSPCAKARSARS